MKKLTKEQLRDFLDVKVVQYNRPEFIENDPISVPHQYQKRQDVEIAAFFASVLAWGQRVTIVKKSKELMQRMDNAPHEFVLHHTTRNLQALQTFSHRTFNGVDTVYFITFLSWLYRQHNSMEVAFAGPQPLCSIEQRLSHFHELFFHLPNAPLRSRKHVSTPVRKSACKRLNMFLRWMVRRDNAGVDFGLWTSISPAQLICPCDLHVERVARKLKLIKHNNAGWLMATELTENLRRLDPHDPVKYDFALFGLGIEEDFGR